MMTTKRNLHPDGMKARAIAYLAGRPAGLHTHTIAAALDVSAERLRAELNRAQSWGLIASVGDPGGQCAGKRKRWCLPQLLQECRAAVAREKGAALTSEWKRVERAGSVQRGRKPIKAWDGVTRRVVAKAHPDLRFHVERVEPFFSSLRPGEYPLPPTSASARSK